MNTFRSKSFKTCKKCFYEKVNLQRHVQEERNVHFWWILLDQKLVDLIFVKQLQFVIKFLPGCGRGCTWWL
jgi:hypothetical protein